MKTISTPWLCVVYTKSERTYRDLYIYIVSLRHAHRPPVPGPPPRPTPGPPRIIYVTLHMPIYRYARPTKKIGTRALQPLTLSITMSGCPLHEEESHDGKDGQPEVS